MLLHSRYYSTTNVDGDSKSLYLQQVELSICLTKQWGTRGMLQLRSKLTGKGTSKPPNLKHSEKYSNQSSSVIHCSRRILLSCIERSFERTDTLLVDSSYQQVAYISLVKFIFIAYVVYFSHLCRYFYRLKQYITNKTHTRMINGRGFYCLRMYILLKFAICI